MRRYFLSDVFVSLFLSVSVCWLNSPAFSASPPFSSCSLTFRPPSLFFSAHLLSLSLRLSLSVSSPFPSFSCCRSGGLSQPSERRVFPGPGVSGEMSLRRHRGRLLQSQADPFTPAHPRTHHRPVSRPAFPASHSYAVLKHQIEGHVLDCSNLKP